jgi:FMN-dependent oxidoreductase (nitrilotriacetate monooxygenase family)
MTTRPRQLVLNLFAKRFGHHPESWRHPTQSGHGRPAVGHWQGLARLAEEAKFHAFFLADFIGRSGGHQEQDRRRGQDYGFEPFTLLGAIAARTERIGIVATVNTNFTHPYTLARQFASLDHISGGRVGWNVVSSLAEHTARNFGLENPPDHGERYEQADEFVRAAKLLWDSYDDDTFDAPDRAGNEFYRAESTHPLHLRGPHYQIEGLLDIPRPIQGYPVFVQAGNSDTGREFAARNAEMIYASATSLDVAQDYYRDVKGRLAKYGRDPSQLHVTPGLSVIVAETDQEAHDRFRELQGLVDFTHGANLFGLDLSQYDLDGPLPEVLPESANGKGRQKQLQELAKRENLTIRQLYLRFAVNRGHVQAVGSVKTVADIIERWFIEHGADGFNVVPPLLPGGFEDFVRLVVPELQKRGIFRRDYQGATLRENLGLIRPENQHRVQRTASAGA